MWARSFFPVEIGIRFPSGIAAARCENAARSPGCHGDANRTSLRAQPCTGQCEWRIDSVVRRCSIASYFPAQTGPIMFSLKRTPARRSRAFPATFYENSPANLRRCKVEEIATRASVKGAANEASNGRRVRPRSSECVLSSRSDRQAAALILGLVPNFAARWRFGRREPRDVPV